MMRAPVVLPFGPEAIARAADLIAAGGIVAIPTETVYGLAADAGSAGGVARIYAAKGRPSFNPLIVHVPDLAAAEALAIFDADATALAARFWPGPLTLVLPLRPGAPIATAVTAGLDTIAIRVPSHRAIRALLAAAGCPLAAPSANRSNGISPTRAAHVVASLGNAVPLVIDDGACPDGVESTIVRGREMLRPGPIARDTLFPGESRGSDTGRLEAGPRPSPGKQAEARITAPGQLASHYAPSKPLRLNAIAAAHDEWLIGFGAVPGDDTLSTTGDLAEAAARLFDALHRADASDRARIAVAPVPAHGIGEAIADRLSRAARPSLSSRA
ncbi:L-threonylcarbamoyladenylate synthase [uncultured Sphingomonas sp.]|uniref:L-threonylcarbamoyladenylate synthase n=1 Tax=uncultured Sphingomonas sp. TaxID=158754 RepID=UPI0035CC766D